MFYYDIAVPVKIRKFFTYMSDKPLKKGCRVLINFNRKSITSYVWSEVETGNLKSAVRYKKIIEVIDETPLLSNELLTIAEWISNYYFCSLGLVISSMLPTALQTQIIQEICLSDKQWGSDDSLPNSKKKILSQLSHNEWLDIKELRSKVGSVAFLKNVEELEDEGYIKVKRLCDSKLKPKYANFITLTTPPKPVSYEQNIQEMSGQETLSVPVQQSLPSLKRGTQKIPVTARQSVAQIPALTPKQQEAYSSIVAFNKDMPLSLLADTVSYSVIKALKSKGLINIEPRIVVEEQTSKTREQSKTVILTQEQKQVLSVIENCMKLKYFEPFLLYGVTGSGKTEIYIRLIKSCLAEGKSALVLVPEIALTPQMEDWFCSVFGDTVAIMHSRRSERERWEEWKRIKKGDCRIVIGARSAVFSPIENLGIIIVDEEHENSYKQDRAPHYNARDIAVLRAKINNIVVVLGSATPSLESFNNAQNDRYKLLRLTKRPATYNRPQVKIVDMKEEDPETLISEILTQKIKERLHNKEQTLLLLNRRGYAAYVICMKCGSVHRCSKCDVSLIYHSESHLLMCHYCGYTEKMKQKCPECGSYVLVYGTAGTQQLEKQLSILFPKAGLLRMDTDTTGKKDSYYNMYQRMKKGSIDILFGTQMIAKGLDFEKVTLVGVISADNSLNIPDFRASERTFQLLTQVAGRSGRGDLSGEVVIQTFNPKHYVIETVKEQDLDQFCEYELPLRNRMMYPPYFRLARIIYSHSDRKLLSAEMNSLSSFIYQLKKNFLISETDIYKNFDNASDTYKPVSILGPVSAPIKMINEKYRYHLIIKSKSVKDLLNIIAYIESGTTISSSVKVDIDIDPLSLM